MEHVATAARAQTAATGAQLQRMTLRAVTTVATTSAPSSSSSMAVPSTALQPDAASAAQPHATAATTRPLVVIPSSTIATTKGITSPPPDEELPEDGPRSGFGQAESHRPTNDVPAGDYDDDVDDVELTRGSSGANTPTTGSRTREVSAGISSPSSRFNAGESRESQQQEGVNNVSTNSNSNNTSDLLLGLSEDDSLYFTED